MEMPGRQKFKKLVVGRSKFLSFCIFLDQETVQGFKVGIIKQLSGLDYRPISKLLCLVTSYWARLRLAQYDVTTHNDFDIGLSFAQ